MLKNSKIWFQWLVDNLNQFICYLRQQLGLLILDDNTRWKKKLIVWEISLINLVIIIIIIIIKC